MIFEYTWWQNSLTNNGTDRLVFRTRASSHAEAVRNYAEAMSKTDDGARLVLVQHRICVMGPLTIEPEKPKVGRRAKCDDTVSPSG